jgi:hypothetical protein
MTSGGGSNPATSGIDLLSVYRAVAGATGLVPADRERNATAIIIIRAAFWQGEDKMPGPGSQWIGKEETRELMDVMESGYLFRYGSLEDPGFEFRKLDDPGGECATLCTVIFESAGRAARVAQKFGTRTVDQSGWHVYANMEHRDRYLREKALPHGKGAYPNTDDILSRSINLSVGVLDAGLGAAFGINIDSAEEEIERVAESFRSACRAA